MTRLKYIFVLALLAFCCSMKAQVLYEISGRSVKQKSYILATNRLVNMQFLDTIPNVFKCFSKCHKVVTEFAMQDYEAIAALRKAAVLPDSVKLSNFYSETEYEYIDNTLRINLGMGGDVPNRTDEAVAPIRRAALDGVVLRVRRCRAWHSCRRTR